MCRLAYQKFCSTLLSHLGSNDPSVSWTAKTQALALTSLKITAREREGIDELISQDGLSLITKLAELSSSSVIGSYESREVEGTVKHACTGTMYMYVCIHVHIYVAVLHTVCRAHVTCTCCVGLHVPCPIQYLCTHATSYLRFA